MHDTKTGNITDFFGVDESDRNWLAVEYVFFEIITYVHFYLALNAYLPMWTFWLGVCVYIPRWMICLHEQQHQCTPKTINPITRLNLLLLTPIQLGYCEMRDIHMRHHAYGATPRDPEYYHIRGHWFMGWLNVMFSPEQSVYFWLKDKKIDKEFVLGVSIRFTLFMSLALYFGFDFLWYLIPVRLAYGTCLYAFSYCLHRKNGEYGTFKIDYPDWLKRIFTPIYGQKLIQSVSEHDIHHDYPRIAGQYLTVSRRCYSPRPTRH